MKRGSCGVMKIDWSRSLSDMTRERDEWRTKCEDQYQAFEKWKKEYFKELNEWKSKFQIMREIAISHAYDGDEFPLPPKFIDDELARRLGEKVVNK
jgi:hypothetical protein